MNKEASFADGPVFVYRITCVPTGKLYFGVTRKTAQARWNGHVKESRAKRFDTVLYRTIRKYGPDSFIVEIVYEAVDGREAQMCERALIAAYGSLVPSGMNTSTGGESHAGRAVSPEVRAKISRSKLGKIMTDEQRKRIGDAHRGLKRSDEVRARQRETMKRPEVREKCLAALDRARHDPKAIAARREHFTKLWKDPDFRQRHAESLARLNARKTANKKPVVKGRGKRGAMLARWQDPVYRGRMLAKIRARVYSETDLAHLRKLADSQRGKPLSEKHRNAIAVAQTGKKKPRHSDAMKVVWRNQEYRAKRVTTKIWPATALVRAMISELPTEYVARPSWD